MESGYCYHITCRANNQEYLLEKYDYKARYQYYLTKAQSKFDTELWSYCLMDNHVHMLMKMYADSISKTMQWLNQNFASSVNLMQGRNGHFFW